MTSWRLGRSRHILVDADSHRASIDVGLSRLVGVHASGQTEGDLRHAQGPGQRFDAHCGLEKNTAPAAPPPANPAIAGHEWPPAFLQLLQTRNLFRRAWG